MVEELKSLKNPTRILTILMFLAVMITSIGAEALGQALPFVPQAIITGIVGVSAYAVTQYGTERRIVRAEALKEQEVIADFEDGFEIETEFDEDGI